MSSAEQLEALIKLETDLKTQYEKKLTAERYRVEALEESQKKLQATIAQQAADIAELNAGGSDLKRLEQENRELGNRCEKLRAENDAQRTKAKGAQKELIELKKEIKDLRQLDAKKLKKNLVDTKKKLEEQRKANDLLTASNRTLKQENHEHTVKVAQLEKELEALKTDELVEPEETSQPELKVAEAG